MNDIIQPSINQASEAEEGSHDASHDDQPSPWAQTVIETLNERSEADRQALLQALMHGHETVADDGAVSAPVHIEKIGEIRRSLRQNDPVSPVRSHWLHRGPLKKGHESVGQEK